MRRCGSVLFATLLIFASSAHSPNAAAADPIAASCRADLPVHPGETMTWRATASGGSGSFTYSWTGSEGLSGSSTVATASYLSAGFKTATVDVTDSGTNERVSTGCGMHVVPSSFVEPPSVTPVLWVPKGVDPGPLTPRLKLAWRSIHALFFHLYGKTFLMHPMVTVVSTQTETDLCGGDCTDRGMADTLVNRAFADASAATGGTIPYTRAMLVMAWGAGGWAGAWGWDIARGAVGDISIASAAGLRTPSIEPDLGAWLLPLLGNYEHGLYSSMAHELNHVIGWDDPHDFSLENPPSAYEKAVVLAGPFLTRTLKDPDPPSVAIVEPSKKRLSGKVPVLVDATDNAAVDAVLVLVDGQVLSIDRSAPFATTINTTLIGDGSHQLTSIALDRTGNRSVDSRTIFVRNRIPGDSCTRSYPAGTFDVCIYDGIGFDGPYLGGFLDHPFPVPALNAGYGINHEWGGGAVAFGRADMVSGVWRGTLDFVTGTYLLHVSTDDGVRVFVNGVRVIDAWHDPQVADLSVVVALSSATRIRVEYYEASGGAGLRLGWQPTRAAVG